MSEVKRLYYWNTRIGTFYIVAFQGYYYPYFDDELLGAYSSPGSAVDDLAGGHTFSLSNGADTATLGIPDSLAEWHRIPR